MPKLLLAVIFLVTLSACTRPQPDLKSPCVGAEGSPCERRAVNNNNV